MGRHFNNDQGQLQTEVPKAPNYLSIASSNADVVFEPFRIPKFGMHGGGLREVGKRISFRITDGSLISGDTVTITYGDRSQGSPGFQVMSISNDAYQMPVYLSFDGSVTTNYLLSPIEFEVVGTAVKGVAGFVPSVVKQGTPFDVLVRSEDEFFNLSTGAHPGYDIYVGDERVAEIAPSNEGLQSVSNVEIDELGFYYFRIEARDGSHVGESNPLKVVEELGDQILWGETHGHSGFAEGQGTPNGYFAFARDQARLDFISLTEHDLWLDDGEWEHLREVTERYNDPGEFVTYMGYEWTVNKGQGGHHNILFRHAKDVGRVPAQLFPTLDQLYDGLNERYHASDVLSIPHAHQTGYWLLSDAGHRILGRDPFITWLF
ncbi:MAG: DUF3604 domain-containing protein [Pseudomonadales bacterium]|nr:DUF3604 domain-containing protein [Pseudomonadales bacterium]